MAEWRFGSGWSERELEERMRKAERTGVNFPATGPGSPEQRDGWRRYYTQAVVGVEDPGPPVPGGAYERVWKAITEYHFSDPSIVVAHFDPKRELLGRTMLLEIKIVGLHYLCATRVDNVRDISTERKTLRGFRYDTLQGHIERGSEWFTLQKNHATGEITFRIQASWRLGEFPNWWSRVGFKVFAERYQLAWHRLAYLRLRTVAGPGTRSLKPVPQGRALVHAGPKMGVPRGGAGGGDAVDDHALWMLTLPTGAAKVALAGKKAKAGGRDDIRPLSTGRPGLKTFAAAKSNAKTKHGAKARAGGK